MKNKLLFIGLVFLVILTFISGCMPKVSLELTSVKEDITSSNQQYTLKFFVRNPTQYTFIGSLEYQHEENCLNTVGKYEEEIEVLPKSKMAFTKTFSYDKKEGNYRIPEEPKCLQIPLRFTTLLKDKSGSIKDNFDTLLTITK